MSKCIVCGEILNPYSDSHTCTYPKHNSTQTQAPCMRAECVDERKASIARAEVIIHERAAYAALLARCEKAESLVKSGEEIMQEYLVEILNAYGLPGKIVTQKWLEAAREVIK